MERFVCKHFTFSVSVSVPRAEMGSRMAKQFNFFALLVKHLGATAIYMEGSSFSAEFGRYLCLRVLETDFELQVV